MSSDIAPGTAVEGHTPGRYARHFIGTLISIDGEGVNRFATVQRYNNTTIKVRPAVLKAITAHSPA